MSLGTKVFYILSNDYAGTVLPTQEDQDPLPESISETGRKDYESEGTAWWIMHREQEFCSSMSC